jgi:mRNA interferase RelE/StbE
MGYSVRLTKTAVRSLGKMDPSVSRLLIGWMRKNLEGCEDPRHLGKGLTSDRTGEWRYRVGNYRILAQIDDMEVVIEVIKVGHRSTIYQRKR